jgi:1-acyl-sn-glycerol-3-phosphate acyltransferase
MKESKALYEFCRFLARLLLPLVLKLRAEGVEHIPARGPVIIAANHIVSMDIIAVSYPVRRHLHHMAKVELFRIPVFGAFIRALGAFPVRRGEGDRDALRMANELLAAGEIVAVFPEGHRSGTGRLQVGLPGVALIALRAGAPIVPVGISGTEGVFKGLRYGPWAPKVRVAYGAPIVLQASGEQRRRDDVQQGIDRVMRAIAALLPPEYRGVYAEPAAQPVTTTAGPSDLEIGGADPQGAERALEDDGGDGGATLPPM